MDAAVQITGKKVVKVLGAACLATGVLLYHQMKQKTFKKKRKIELWQN